MPHLAGPAEQAAGPDLQARAARRAPQQAAGGGERSAAATI